MTKKSTKTDSSDANAEFKRLFWEARKEQSRLGKKATANDAAYRAAMEFAKNQGWQWAEALLEASLLDRIGESSKVIEILNGQQTAVPYEFQGLFYFVHGFALDNKGEHEEAIKAYHKALNDPNFDTPGMAWNNIGLALDNKGDYEEAIKAYHKALDNPNFDRPSYAWHNLGNALSNMGDYEEAIKAYHKALDANYDTPGTTWANLALSYENLEKFAEAKDAYQKALQFPDALGTDHARARLGLQRLSANIEIEELSPDDRALAEKPKPGVSTNEIENSIIAEIRNAGDTQYEKYLEKPDSTREESLSILRGWSSAVTLLEGSERRWRGGGYFLKWRGFGIVIDPGFDFLRNFHDAGFHGREIHAVLVSHNHPDHNSDLKDIDDLRYELWKRLKDSGKSGSQPYVLVWDEDTAAATKFGMEEPKHLYAPVVMTYGFPQPFNLLEHGAKIPIRVTPFQVKHSSDVPHAMGMLIELLDEKGKSVLRIGYTGDTGYFEDLPKHLEKCDILIAHISQPSIEELQDATKPKDIHLGYRGTIRLVKECQPKLALIGEWWAGFTDLRILLVKGIRHHSGVQNVIPAGLAMHLKLPSLEIECTECGKLTPFPKSKIAPPTDKFGSLAYLCPNCLLG